jgi:hypothetical protein
MMAAAWKDRPRQGVASSRVRAVARASSGVLAEWTSGLPRVHVSWYLWIFR